MVATVRKARSAYVFKGILQIQFVKRFEILNMFYINGNAKVMKKKSTLIERSFHEL